MKEIFMIINTNPDGDTYSFHTDFESANSEYEMLVEDLDGESGCYMTKVTQGRAFGFGARGEFFGGELIKFENQ